jgi:hypothetical protein
MPVPQKRLQKYFNDFLKLNFTNSLFLRIDSYRNEIERLKRSNIDLENERNTIKQNLKQMLELQMKETMQLLGINNNNNSTDNSNGIVGTVESTSKTIPASSNYDSIEKIKSNYSELNNQKEANNSFLSPISKKIDEFHLDTLRELGALNFENKRQQSVFELTNTSMHAGYKLETSSPKPQVKTPKFNEPNISLINKVKQTSAPSNSIVDLMNSMNFSQCLSNKLNQSLNTPPASVQTSNRKTQVASHQKVEIKDNFILDQIDIINKYYKIDDKTLAAASNLNLDKSNLSLNTSGNEKSNLLVKHSLCNYDSKLKNSNNNINNANETTILNESSCFNTQTISTGNFKRLNLKEVNKFKTAKSMLNIFQDEKINEINKKIDFNEQKQNCEDNNSILRTRSYSSNDQNDELSNVNSMMINSQTNPSRATELRHLIEILLNRSPTSEKNNSQTNRGKIYFYQFCFCKILILEFQEEKNSRI